MFVRVCTAQGSPTLEQVKGFCLDLIECVYMNIPRISHHESAIQKANTMEELARAICFRLSNWVSYDFFKKVITEFQPALKSVEDRLMHYQDKLRPILLQKLEHIAELQQRYVAEIIITASAR